LDLCAQRSDREASAAYWSGILAVAIGSTQLWKASGTTLLAISQQNANLLPLLLLLLLLLAPLLLLQGQLTTWWPGSV
jgi:hypothetical protein